MERSQSTYDPMNLKGRPKDSFPDIPRVLSFGRPLAFKFFLMNTLLLYKRGKITV